VRLDFDAETLARFDSGEAHDRPQDMAVNG
jgi:hypothetical protein